MIIQIGTDADESRILWKYKESDEWKRADIDELIRAYENKHEAVRCKYCKYGQYDCTHMYCDYFGHKVYEDDYCSNAVRRRNNVDN